MSRNLILKRALSSGKIYLREDTITYIKSFLNNKLESILHITGNPGVGKTSIVKYVCTDYLYLNTLLDKDIKKQILNTNQNLIIIDEFDELDKYTTRFIIGYVKDNKKKLITLSNTLKTGSYILKPYTSDEIKRIVECKMDYEIEERVWDDKMVQVVSKKFSSKGDMRGVFDYLIKEDKNIVNETCQETWHHRIIKELGHFTKRKAYCEYLIKCEEECFPPLQRLDFYTLFDLYNK